MVLNTYPEIDVVAFYYNGHAVVTSEQMKVNAGKFICNEGDDNSEFITADEIVEAVNTKGIKQNK